VNLANAEAAAALGDYALAVVEAAAAGSIEDMRLEFRFSQDAQNRQRAA
jgi:hypothetical protein